MATALLETRAGRRAMARTAPEGRDYMAMARDGWNVVSTRSGDRGGMTAHRGVLHPDEYVDFVSLAKAVQARLGFTLEELHTTYRQGRKSAGQLELRGRIDARFLEIRDAGGNLELLARFVGLERTVIGRAAARARMSSDPIPNVHVPGSPWVGDPTTESVRRPA